MCVDPPGQRLRRMAVCSCGAYFPECDLEDAKMHINPKPGVRNHAWIFIHKQWAGVACINAPLDTGETLG